MAKEIRIECPCCKTKYLPGEIYLPKAFLGQPKYVERDSQDFRILNFDPNGNMDLDEDFVCETCGTHFKVHADVNFTTKEYESSKEEYKTDLFTPKITLGED